MPQVSFAAGKNNDIFNPKSALNRDNCLHPFIHLKNVLSKIGWKIDTCDMVDADSSDFIIFLNIPSRGHQKEFYDKCVKSGLQHKMVAILLEPPVTLPHNWDIRNHQNFKTIFTWNDDFVDNKKYFKFYFPQPPIPKIKQAPFSEKKLCTMVTGNNISSDPRELYTERIKAARFFEKNAPGDFNLYGTQWNRRFSLRRLYHIRNFRSMQAYFSTSRLFTSYKGPVKSKLETLSKYKFSICYENAKGFNGYVTEKIFDSLMARCVPIYLGADNIYDYVDKGTFIDKRKFTDYKELLCFIKSIDKEEHEEYTNRINEYLSSKKYRLFSSENFARIIIDTLSIS